MLFFLPSADSGVTDPGSGKPDPDPRSGSPDPTLEKNTDPTQQKILYLWKTVCVSYLSEKANPDPILRKNRFRPQE